MQLSSDVVTISKQKILEENSREFPIDQIKTPDSFCVIEGKHSHHLPSLAGCEYFPYASGVFEGKLITAVLHGTICMTLI